MQRPETMSAPHSILHATNYVDVKEEQQPPAKNGKNKATEPQPNQGLVSDRDERAKGDQVPVANVSLIRFLGSSPTEILVLGLHEESCAMNFSPQMRNLKSRWLFDQCWDRVLLQYKLSNHVVPLLPTTKQGGFGFQKMRRRLTVTGASETIDGVSKLSVSDTLPPAPQYQSKVSNSTNFWKRGDR